LPPHPVEHVRTLVGDGARELAKRALGGTADETAVGALEAAFKADYARTWRGGTSVFPGIPELLRRLAAAGHALTVLSNKPHPFTVEIVDALFPGIPFALVLGQRPEVPRKPDPAGALEIADRLELAPSDCTVIGDSTMDLETGRRAGMRTIAVTWGYHDADALAGADALANDPAALARVLLK
jgi:phosphoglycolate phosphatase